MPAGIRNSQISDIKENEWDYALDSPSRLHGSHTSIIPMSSNTQSARLFYGARFVNQAMPLENRETPLVQSLDPESADGLSFEQQYGRRMGARFADDDAEVSKITPDGIELKLADGSKKTVDLYNNFQFNRKTYLHNTPRVQVGDKVKKGQILASSNFTDNDGTIAMGLNARTALVAYKGFSMDDAIVVSESFAKRMASMHNYQHEQAKDEELKYGKDHFSSVFPRKFTKEQLELMDDNGMVRPGTILHKGDPIMLATRPKPVYSNSEHLGKLGKVFRTIRGDASQVWDHDYPGMVTDVVDGKKNRKVFITAKAPLEVGDKIIASRPGQKGILSKIIPDNEMLRGEDGKPFEVLLNPLALPSRVNTTTLYELAYGKIAAKQGKPIAVSNYTKAGTSRLDEVTKALKEAGVSPTERVYDPAANRWLEKPVTTGISYTYKLHHMVASKKSARGNAAYDVNEQPLRGSSDSAQAKRLGGLETTALMAKGAYETLRDASTVRGANNAAYWRAIRQGYKPMEPGTPFVVEKFKAMLNGAGMNPRDLGKGVLRLSPFTDKDLDSREPVEIENGKLVRPDNLEPEAGGLFDPKLVALGKWGKISLPCKLPNPAMESQIALMLGVKISDLRRVIAGEVDLEDVQKKRKD